MGTFNVRNIRKPRPFWAKAIGNTCVLAGSSTSISMAFAEAGVWATVIPSIIAILGLLFSEMYKAADEEYTKQEEAEVSIEQKTTVTVKKTDNDN